ncbi:putative cytochrome P450 [Helianthus anomalus]
MDQLSHCGLAHLAEKYGGIFHIKMGFNHTIVVSSPEMAREILQVQDHIFANRLATIAITYLTYNRADMAFADYGMFWCQMRKLSVMKLFSRKRAESWDSVRDEVDSMVKSTLVKSGSPVNLGELLFGVNLADFILWFGFIVPAGLNTRLPATQADLDRFIDKIIDNHLRKREKICHQNADKDMVDEMLEFLTVAFAIEWAMIELMHTPEALKRVQQELANVVGLERRVEKANLEKLTYFKCVVKETLCQHPPIPVALHKSSTDTMVMGYHIPKAARVMVNAYVINRDKNSWEDPNTFNPSRFLAKRGPPSET